MRRGVLLLALLLPALARGEQPCGELHEEGSVWVACDSLAFRNPYIENRLFRYLTAAPQSSDTSLTRATCYFGRNPPCLLIKATLKILLESKGPTKIRFWVHGRMGEDWYEIATWDYKLAASVPVSEFRVLLVPRAFAEVHPVDSADSLVFLSNGEMDQLKECQELRFGYANLGWYAVHGSMVLRRIFREP